MDAGLFDVGGGGLEFHEFHFGPKLVVQGVPRGSQILKKALGSNYRG